MIATKRKKIKAVARQGAKPPRKTPDCRACPGERPCIECEAIDSKPTSRRGITVAGLLSPDAVLNVAGAPRARRNGKPRGEGSCQLSVVSSGQLTTDHGPLTNTERKRLKKLEDVVVANTRAFQEYGLALITIRDERLYRETHATFEAYCRERFDFSRQYAYRIMDSAAIRQQLSTIVDMPPANESQARPLAKVDADQRAEVWKQVLDRAKIRTTNGRPTTAIVEETVRDWTRTFDEVEAAPEKPRKGAKTQSRTLDQQMAGYEAAAEMAADPDSMIAEVRDYLKRMSAFLGDDVVLQKRLQIELLRFGNSLAIKYGFALLAEMVPLEPLTPEGKPQIMAASKRRPR